MRRKQLCKKVATIILAATMVFTEVPVMAGDFVDGTTENIPLEVTQEDEKQETLEAAEKDEEEITVDQEAVGDAEETDLDISDAEEKTDEISVPAEQEYDTEDAEFISEESQETPAESVGEDEDNLLGGDTVVEASTSDWKYIYNSTGAALTEYLGEDGNVTIPVTIGGKKVIACKKISCGMQKLR